MVSLSPYTICSGLTARADNDVVVRHKKYAQDWAVDSPQPLHATGGNSRVGHKDIVPGSEGPFRVEAMQFSSRAGGDRDVQCGS